MKDYSTMGLFEYGGRTEWVAPTELPILDRFDTIYWDLETTGKHKRTDKSVGDCVTTPDGRSYYLPHAHDGGGNMCSVETKMRWRREQFRNKRIVNLNIGFDAEISRNDGVDLELGENVLHDIAHSAALLNENRVSGFNLDELGHEYVGHGKVDLGGTRPENIWREHASMVGVYGENDSRLVYEVDVAQQALIGKENLNKVQRLEDAIIWPNLHMERNAARIDVKKLDEWRESIGIDIGEVLLDIHDKTGVVLNPRATSSKGPNSMWYLFKKLGLEMPVDDVTGKESFGADLLMRLNDETVKLALYAKRLLSIQSKYLEGYRKVLFGELLEFSLHQLRSTKEEGADASAMGTITGRYSCVNENIQQVMKVLKQYETFGELFKYIIRELFIPDDGFDMFAADASQIEFRLFAHFASKMLKGKAKIAADDLVKQYCDDPHIDFHMLVTIMMCPTISDKAKLKVLRSTVYKHLNFGILYGMGALKLSRKQGLFCICGEPENFWNNENHEPNCPARISNDNKREYDRKFPAAAALMRLCMDIAKEEGYICDIIGRRGRFPTGDAFHKALNKMIQGSAATCFKVKILKLYRAMKTIGIHKLRYPVHDEQVGDIDKDPAARVRLEECLREQDFTLAVPLLWEVGYGDNWRQCT